MTKHGLFGSKAYADNLGRLVGALGVLIQWLYVLLVFHGLSSLNQAS